MSHAPKKAKALEVASHNPYFSHVFAFIHGADPDRILTAFRAAFDRAFDEELKAMGAYLDPEPGDGAWEAWIVCRQAYAKEG